MTVLLVTNGFLFALPAPSAEAAAQNAYRWRNDNGTEAAATWAADENTPIANVGKGVAERLRVGVNKDANNSEMIRKATTALRQGEQTPISAAIDTVHGYAYFGIMMNPAVLVKVALGSGANPPVRVGELQLDYGSYGLTAISIDAVHGYAYVSGGFYNTPSKITKVALGVGDASPTKVGELLLNAPEQQIWASALDVANGYGYFGTGSSPGTIVKVALGAGSAPPTRVGTLTLNIGENDVESAVLDTANGYGWFATWQSPSHVIKVALGAGSAPPTRIGAVTLNAGENNVWNTGVIDTTNGYAYFAASVSPGILVKVALGTGAAPPTRVGAATFNSGENSPQSASIDVANGYAYVGCYTSPGTVVKVALGAGSDPPARVAAVTFNAGEINLWGAGVIDPVAGYGWFGTNTTPGIIVKISLGAGSNPPARLNALTLDIGDGSLMTAVIDNANGYAYFGANRRIIKVRVGSGADPPVRVGSVDLQTTETNFDAAVIDTANGYAYFGTQNNPAQIVKIALGAGDAPPTRIGVINLPADEYYVYSAVIDTANGYAYFGTGTSTGKVVKIRLSDFTRLGSLTLTGDGNGGFGAVMDAANGYAYFGTFASPARVAKVALGVGDALPTKVGSLQLNTGESGTRAAVVDTANGYGYFVMNTSPVRVVKVALGSGATLPTRVGAVTLNSGENSAYSAAIDTTNGYAYLGTYSTPGLIVKVALGSGANPPTRADAFTLSSPDINVYSAVIDPAHGYAYFGTLTQPARVIQMSTSDHFALQYGVKNTTCSDISSWTTVSGTTTNHWMLSNSLYVADDTVTTNVSGGVSDGGANFKAGRFLDASSPSRPILLETNDFTEMEWSVKATSAASYEGDYCFRVSNDGVTTGLTYANYPEAVISPPPSLPTLNNQVTLGRLMAGATSQFDISFQLQNPRTSTLTITFPSAFTLSGAPTLGTCSGGGTVDNFAFSNITKTMTADKHACGGTLTLTGATIINPSISGIYTINWVNDDPGSASIMIVGDDSVMVDANVDPYLTFNVGTQAWNVACSGTFSGNGGTLVLGTLHPDTITTSDASSDHICTRLSTNGTGGAVVTVKSSNSGLKSASVPTDLITSADGALTAGFANYGLCVGSGSGDASSDLTTPVGALPAAASPFGSGCSISAHNVGGLTGAAQPVWTLSRYAQNAFARIFVKATISATTPAHNDYSDTLTFVATGTY